MKKLDFVVAFLLIAFAYVGGHADERDDASRKRILQGDTKIVDGHTVQVPLTYEQGMAEGHAMRLRAFYSELEGEDSLIKDRFRFATKQTREKMNAAFDKYDQRILDAKKQLHKLENARKREVLRFLDTQN